MIIESVAAASAALTAINGLIQQVNETGNGVQQVMGTISDFGEAITQFELDRRNSTFKPISQNELLKLQMIKRSYERHWQEIHDLLLIADPQLLEDFKKAKEQQEQQRRAHLRMLARKRKERQRLMTQISVGAVTFLIGSIIAAGIVFIVIKAFSR